MMIMYAVMGAILIFRPWGLSGEEEYAVPARVALMSAVHAGGLGRAAVAARPPPLLHPHRPADLRPLRALARPDPRLRGHGVVRPCRLLRPRRLCERAVLLIEGRRRSRRARRGAALAALVALPVGWLPPGPPGSTSRCSPLPSGRCSSSSRCVGERHRRRGRPVRRPAQRRSSASTSPRRSASTTSAPRCASALLSWRGGSSTRGSATSCAPSARTRRAPSAIGYDSGATSSSPSSSAALFAAVSGTLYVLLLRYASPEAMDWIRSGNVVVMVPRRRHRHVDRPHHRGDAHHLPQQLLSFHTEYWQLVIRSGVRGDGDVLAAAGSPDTCSARESRIRR